LLIRLINISQTVAAVFSLLNDYRLSTGKTSLGFINPLIYSAAASGFTDITSGSNPGCGTTGFTAGKGWDPVSCCIYIFHYPRTEVFISRSPALVRQISWLCSSWCKAPLKGQLSNDLNVSILIYQRMHCFRCCKLSNTPEPRSLVEAHRHISPS